MVFAVAVPEGALAVFDVLIPLAVTFAVPAEPDMVVGWEVDGLEVVVTEVVMVGFGAVGLPDVSWIGPPMRMLLSALFFFHYVRLCGSKSLPTCSTRKR